MMKPSNDKPLLLDTYCKAGGCTAGFQRAGFYVVGVDIQKQPNYCGDEFYQGDAVEFIREHGNVMKIQRVVDNIGNFTIVVELPDPRSPTLREADGDTYPSVASSDDQSVIIKDNNVQLEKDSGHV